MEPSSPYLVLQAFGLISAAEIMDKTMILCLSLGLMYPMREVLLGMSLASVVVSFIGVAFGAGTAQLFMPSDRIIAGISGSVFLALAVWSVKEAREKDAHKREHDLAANAIWITFSGFFLNEIGDRTEFATVALAAQHPQIVSASMIFLGASVALIVCNAAAIMLGHVLGMHRWPRSKVLYGSAIIFAASGLWQIAAALGYDSKNIILPLWEQLTS